MTSVLRTITLLATCAGGQAALAETVFTPIPTQYIAALGDSGAQSGNDAASWGLWPIDPGPRGVALDDYAALQAAAGIAPDGWQFDSQSWWLEEHGLIMEAPQFPLPPGRYVVTGGRETVALLTVSEPDATGAQAWSLSEGTTIYDVTHLRCRAANYVPLAEGQACAPDTVNRSVFPMVPGALMPQVQGCLQQDYQVLIVIGMASEG